MTIICALHVAGETWVGADSQVTMGGLAMPLQARKWIVAQDGSKALSVGGEGRSEVLVRRLDLDGLSDAGACAEALKKALVADGYLGGRDGEPGAPRYGNPFVYADRTGIWDIDAGFSCWSIPPGTLWARGSGMEYGLGADDALVAALPDAHPEERIRAALKAAIRFDTGCGGELFVRKL